MLEIYNEQVRDLLNPSTKAGSESKGLEIRQGGKEKGTFVSGLEVRAVSAYDDVVSIMNEGNSNRAVGCHNLNEHSSRSHSVLTILVEGTNKHTGRGLRGKLNLIDLAGSERVSKTDASGERLKEAQFINKSLSAIGDVVAT